MAESKPEQQVSAPWPDLLPELLGLVLSRMPSHADRVRLRAVCRPWRSSSTNQPLLPWLALRDGTFLSFPDGEVYRLPVPADVYHRVSAGGTIFLVHADGKCSLMTNPFTGETAPQHMDPDVLWFQMTILTPRQLVAHFRIAKVVVSDHVVATKGRRGAKPRICARGPPQTCTPPVVELQLHADDIDFFQGMLYAVRSKDVDTPTLGVVPHRRELHVFDFITRDPPILCIPGTTIAHSTGLYQLYYYLVVSGDRLLMVEREIELSVVSSKPIRTRRLEVFEATGLHNGAGNGRWIKVDNLMGHALFVSQDCSRSLPVANQYGAHQDCVYFLSEHSLNDNYLKGRKAEDDFLDSGVYNIGDQTLAPLPTEMAPMKTAVVSHAGKGSLSWLFLPQN
ncbi:hypothetical protein BRADI_2g00515v3 [Brachypodium distachyon]|uniref:Uncharacterized protein n=1 Tax=Brachypodium distachyon TaxID=15368 RepID=I1HB45_BRADI|nr:hypothetical protein BRADI_2g00515v3 [Brachypodium distachyon]